MRTIFALLAAAALACLAACSQSSTAQTAAVSDTLTWTNPTANTDGSALTNLASIRIQWGTASGGPYSAGSVTVADTAAAPVTSTVIPRTGSGVGTICYIAVAVASSGTESVPTNEACKTVAPPPTVPGPPTGLGVK